MSIHKLSVKITPLERFVRIAVGLVGVVAPALLLLRDAGSGWEAALYGLLALAGLDLVVTGATGHCPLYQKLGHVPASLKGRTS